MAIHGVQERVSTSELASEKERILREQGVTIRDEEHLVYYREFVTQFPDGHLKGQERKGRLPCVGCGYELKHEKALFCRESPLALSPLGQARRKHTPSLRHSTFCCATRD